LYNGERFKEVSVLTVDYQMPKMTGLDLARIYSQHNVEIIMFTGEASTEIGVSALNTEVIARFLQKGVPHLDDTLRKTIKELQYKHFEEASQLILNNFSVRGEVPMPSFFDNGHFAVFFKNLLEKHAIIEYYILNYEGDFILIDRLHQIHYLTIRDENGYQDLFLESQAGYYDEPTDEAKAFLEEIKNKKKMPFLWGLKTVPEFLDWPVYPVKIEACDSIPYWYAWIENDPLDRGIDLSKIKFYTP
jgi:CheY-like chemotaxis protein